MTVSQKQLADAVAKAIKNAGDSHGTPVVKLEVTTAQDARSLQMTLPNSALTTLSREEGATLTVSSAVAQITFDDKTLKAIAEQAESEILLMVTPIQASDLNEVQTAAVGQFPVMELTLQSNGVVISDFKAGNATVALPYILAKDQQAEGIVVWYLDEEGGTTVCETRYDKVAGKVTFVTPHFSKYVIAYDESRLPDQPDQVQASQQPQPTQPTDAPAQSHSLPVLPIVLGGAALVLILAAVFWLRRRSLDRQDQE